MKRIGILLLVGATVALAASSCDGGEATSSSSTTNGAGGEGGSGGTGGTGGTGTNPAAPKAGALLERMGRPAINTALNHPFDNVPETQDAAKDKWNTDEPADWSSHQAEVEKNLAILDGVDTTCGNQLLAGVDVAPGRYAGLAGALIEDRLWVRTDATTCGAYLAVEADAVGILANMDCGGRTLAYDVIDVSYSALAAGTLTGVDDGIPVPSDVGGTTFPYLVAPQ